MKYRDCIVCKNKTDDRGMNIGNVGEAGETVMYATIGWKLRVNG